MRKGKPEEIHRDNVYVGDIVIARSGMSIPGKSLVFNIYMNCISNFSL